MLDWLLQVNEVRSQ